MAANASDVDQAREIYREVVKLGNWKELILAWEGSNDHIVKLLLEALCKKYPKEAAEGRNRKPDPENHTSPLLNEAPGDAPGDEEENLKASHENRKVCFPITRLLTPAFI
ncbi:unnamed protein product, partial [Allacma fusca]